MDISKLRNLPPDELYKKMDGWNPGDPQYEQAKMEFLRQIGEQQIKSARILEDYTRTLIRLTRALVWLTIALLVVAVGIEILHQCAHP